jgi:hypothetical protein
MSRKTIERIFFVSKPYPLLWLGEKKLEIRGIARVVRVVPGFLNREGDNYYQYVFRSLQRSERPDYWPVLDEGWRVSRWQPQVHIPGIYVVAGGVWPRVVSVREVIKVHRMHVKEAETFFNIKLLVPPGTGIYTNAIILGDYEPLLEEVTLEDVVEYGTLCNPPEYVDLRQFMESPSFCVEEVED